MVETGTAREPKANNDERHYYTRFERARVIGARALQVALGAPVLVRTTEEIIDPVKISMMEFEQGVIPLTARPVDTKSRGDG